jgi:hypothetical protein
MKELTLPTTEEYHDRFNCVKQVLSFFHKSIPKGNIMSSKDYGLFKFLFDVIMCGFTGGLWLIWIFVREMRRR